MAPDDTQGELREHDVVIVGGGQGGVSLAARLWRDGFRDIAIVEPRTVHRYQPLLSYVGGGQATISDLERPQRKVVPAGVVWYSAAANAVDPRTRTVTITDGRRLRANDLALCPGVGPDWDDIPGSREAVFSAHGCSNYVGDRALHTWDLVARMRSGDAMFVIADGPIPCAGTGLKPLFLAVDHWRRQRVLRDLTVTVVVPWPTIFGIPEVDAHLDEFADRYGITVLTGTRVRRIDAADRTIDLSYAEPHARLRNQATDVRLRSGQPDTQLRYDLLHLTPRHRAPHWLTGCDLAGDDAETSADPTIGDPLIAARVAGMIEVDPKTLAHRRHQGVWGLGDAADVAASRSGGALRKQAAVVADNIARRRADRPLVSYDGYTTAPITVGRNRLLLAEYDRHGRLTPSVPGIDLIQPRFSTWAYDRYLQPQLYWHNILKGRVRR